MGNTQMQLAPGSILTRPYLLQVGAAKLALSEQRAVMKTSVAALRKAETRIQVLSSKLDAHRAQLAKTTDGDTTAATAASAGAATDTVLVTVPSTAGDVESYPSPKTAAISSLSDMTVVVMHEDDVAVDDDHVAEKAPVSTNGNVAKEQVGEDGEVAASRDVAASGHIGVNGHMAVSDRVAANDHVAANGHAAASNLSCVSTGGAAAMAAPSAHSGGMAPVRVSPQASAMLAPFAASTTQPEPLTATQPQALAVQGTTLVSLASSVGSLDAASASEGVPLVSSASTVDSVVATEMNSLQAGSVPPVQTPHSSMPAAGNRSSAVAVGDDRTLSSRGGLTRSTNPRATKWEQELRGWEAQLGPLKEALAAAEAALRGAEKVGWGTVGMGGGGQSAVRIFVHH